MRKVRSAPQLAGLEAKSAIASSAAAGSPRHIHAGPTAAGKQGFQVKGSVKVRDPGLRYYGHYTACYASLHTLSMLDDAGGFLASCSYACSWLSKLLLIQAPPKRADDRPTTNATCLRH